MADPSDDTPAQQRLAAANQQIRRERLAAANRALAEARTRQQVAVIDELIALLEERNLDRQRDIDRAVRSRLRQHDPALGLTFPRRVMRARNTARLHGALLDWLESVHDQIVPPRRQAPGGPDLD